LVEPIISGIGWVSELIEIAGGVDCYAENAKHQGGKERIIADPLDGVARNFILKKLVCAAVGLMYQLSKRAMCTKLNQRISFNLGQLP